MRILISAGSDALSKLGQRVGLTDEEAHHLRVRRAKEGEKVEILDGAGSRGSGRLVRTGKEWKVEIETLEREPPPPQLTLAVATGDRARFSWLVEKAAELGVTTIVPLRMARSAGVSTGIRDGHLPRLRHHAREATKQCGAAWAVEVEALAGLEEFLGRPANGTRWLADQSGAPVTSQLDPSPVTVLVGPEGGLTEGERLAALAAGYLPVALSPHTLRFETAAMAAAAAVSAARMRGSHG
jgi:16S rRNA (uracil1498-N3)-methyltransferase